MTVSSSYAPNVSTGNGVTTVFPFSFRILAAADLQVTVDGVVQTLGVHYTVSGIGSGSGGDVTFLTAPANAAQVIRRRKMAKVRATDYQDNGDLLADSLNEDQDAPVMMMQEVQEEVDRGIKLPVGESAAVILPSAGDRAGKVLVFDDEGDVTVGENDFEALRASAAASALSAAASLAAAGGRAIAVAGVIGDGVTNDRTAFSNALAALPSGSVLDLGGLSIVIGNGLTITGKSNIEIRNGKLLGKLTDTTGYMLTLDSCTNVKITNVEFDAKNSYVSAQQLTAMRVVDCSDVTIDGVNFSDVYYGVLTGGTTNNRIRLNRCSMVGRLAYSAPNAAAFLLAQAMFYAFAPAFDSGVSYSYGEKSSHLILVEDTSGDCYASFNTVKNSHDTSIYFYCPGALATGNKVYYAGKDGIKVNGTLGLGARITNNFVYGAGVIKSDGGVCITSLSADAVIEGNVVYLLPVASRAAASTIGIVLYNSNQSAEGNVITSITPADVSTLGIILGTTLAANASNISIANNVLTGLLEAIKWGQPTGFVYSNINITGNRIKDCARGIYGFLVDTSYTKMNKVVLVNNTITNYTDSAIIMTLSDDVLVSGNRGYGGSASAKFFNNQGSHNVTFTNNGTDGTEANFVLDASSPTYLARFGNMKAGVPQSPGTPARAYSTAGRPGASTVTTGSWVWNIDTNKPNWSDGTNWRDAAGTVV